MQTNQLIILKNKEFGGMRNKGQIKLDSNLGKWIYRLSKSPEVKSIVEVGTWYGMGSTYCIKKGLEDRENPIREGYSIECVRERHYQACENLGSLPENFFLLYGSIISYQELIELESKIVGKQQLQWFKEDLKHTKEAPFIGDPMQGLIIDLCILDGSEFSGMFDFFRLGIHSKYVILDDTNAYKHKQTRSYILSHKDWEVLADVTTERNGYMICRNGIY